MEIEQFEQALPIISKIQYLEKIKKDCINSGNATGFYPGNTLKSSLSGEDFCYTSNVLSDFNKEVDAIVFKEFIGFINRVEYKIQKEIDKKKKELSKL
jgi:hypothetical protein